MEPALAVPASQPGAEWSHGGVKWATEPVARDAAINLIRPGGNYGWPAQRGPGGASRGFVDPIWSSGPAGTLATSGAAFVSAQAWGLWAGSLFVASLKESDLRRFTLDGGAAVQRDVLLDRRYGRLSSPVLGPNGALYVTTSNGAGDRIVRLTASQ